MRIRFEIDRTEIDAFKRIIESRGAVGNEYEILSEANAHALASYDAKLSETNNWLISIVISVFSPFITDAIREFVDYCKTEIIVTTEDENYIINKNNVDCVLPEFRNDLENSLTDEQNAKNRRI